MKKKNCAITRKYFVLEMNPFSRIYIKNVLFYYFILYSSVFWSILNVWRMKFSRISVFFFRLGYFLWSMSQSTFNIHACEVHFRLCVQFQLLKHKYMAVCSYIFKLSLNIFKYFWNEPFYDLKKSNTNRLNFLFHFCL